MAEAATWVATIRVWTDREPARVRVLVGTADDADVAELVGSSIEEGCGLLAAYLRDRIG